MRCQEALVQMSAALDGELDPAGASSLQQHLASCDACRTDQEQLQAVDQRLRAPRLQMVSVPEELRGRIAGKLASQLTAARPARRRASPLAFAVAFTGAAAAAAALAMAGPTADEPIATDGTSAGRPPGDQDPSAGQLPAPASNLTATRIRPAPRAHGGGQDHPCRLARAASTSPVARACAAGGTAQARRTMRGLVDAARARGQRFECRDCHRNEVDFQLDEGARQRFARLLTAAGA